jgi:hypothetical protein
MNKKLKGETRARLLSKENQYIQFIRYLRIANPSLSLKEAKDVVDGWGCFYSTTTTPADSSPKRFELIAASSPKQNWAELEKKINSAPDWMKDKERLDWLDEKSTHWSSGNGGMYTFHAPLDSQDIRAAIDAAMRKEKKS